MSLPVILFLDGKFESTSNVVCELKSPHAIVANTGVSCAKGKAMVGVQELIDEAVNGIVAEVHPLRVFVFGSVARGEARADSDLDLLVVVPDTADRLETAFALHRRLTGLACPKDIVVVLEHEFSMLQDDPNLVIHTALTEGKEVYRAA